MSSTDLSIGELARRSGRRPSAIRYYEQIGLLPAAARIGGRRRYPEEAVRTLAVIDTAQRAGLSLEETTTLLTADSEQAAGEELQRLAQQKLPELAATVERLAVVSRWLEAAARCECPNLDDCRLFDQTAELPPTR